MYEIHVQGIPASVSTDGSGYYATVTFQRILVNGSPLIVDLVPPVATIGEISFPALVDAVVAAIQQGAVLVF